MTYAEMIATLSNLNNTQSIPLSALPHCSNLLHQLNKGDPSKENVYNQIVNLYIPMRQVLFCENDIAEYVTSVTEKTNEYMDMLKTLPKSLFPHQADFLSSIVPEMLCVLFWHIISGKDVELEVSAQKDLTIECTFDTSNGGTIRFKNKRVDVAVVKPCHLLFNSTNTELPIPLMAIECKTNLDKNMISGIEHSVNELKKTFPDCKYFVVSELSDFDAKKSNYASSGIDEIYILRQQKRSIVRNNPLQRKPLNPDLVMEVANILVESITAMRTEVVNLEARMHNGKLIGRPL